MKHCKHCGAQLADDDNYCYFCGASLEEETEQVKADYIDERYQEYKNSERYQNYMERRPNTIAIIGFVFAFVSPIIGLVLSIIGLNRARMDHGNGRGYAIAGIIVAIMNFIFTFLFYFVIYYTAQGGTE